MDQSASVFSEAGSALFVSFSPKLAARPVSFPPSAPELTFLVAQSFVAADKHVTGPIHYNLRVVECTLAAEYLNAVLNPPGTRLPGDAAPLGVSLHGFHETYFALRAHAGEPVPRGAEEQLAALLALAEATLDEEGYTREQVAAALNMSVGELDERYTSAFPVRATRFRLRQRAAHVFGEAARVLRFLALLEAEADLARLGSLMNESQESCRALYECSCPELDELCAIARRAGAHGSRLTGAGWGGCSVHLVPADKVDAVKEAWEREYYAKRDLTTEQREAAVVVSRPGSGSAVWRGTL
jgi:galactokinase